MHVPPTLNDLTATENKEQGYNFLSTGVLQKMMNNGNTSVTYRIKLRMRIVVIHYELIMVLPPGEYVAPVRLVVRDHRESVTPRLYYGSHVV